MQDYQSQEEYYYFECGEETMIGEQTIKTPMYLCQSIFNGETNQIENCTCGKCAEALKNKE